MPRKSVTENSKATAARLRKAAAKEAEDISKEKGLEDEYWKEDDKLVLRKEQRKKKREEKKQQALEKKQTNKALFEKEMAITGKCCKQESAKITRAQILEASNSKQVTTKKVTNNAELPLVENTNKLITKEEQARSVSEAIALLNVTPERIDKHPEKRLKATFLAFEESRLRQLQVENPTLKHSQLKAILFKEWQKSPQNPLNKTQL